MATIATLAVSVQARTKKFNKGMKKAGKTLSRFAAKAKMVAIRGAKIGAALGAAALAGIAVFVKKQLSAIDATAKLSDRLGIATEDLQRLRFAAKITGADAETLDKSMEQLSKRLGEAAQGLGTGKDGLKALGIELDDIIGKDPAEQFKIIADAVEKLGTQEEKVAATTQLFGRSGTKLVNTLALGRSGIEKLGNQADKLGLSFNRVDAAKVEQANDAMTRLGALFEGVFARLTIEFAPFIEKAANKLVEMGTSGEGAAKKVLKGFEFILLAVAKTADFISLLNAAWLKFASLVQTGASAIVESLIPVLETFRDLGNLLGIDTGITIEPLLDQAILLTDAARKTRKESEKAFANFTSGAQQGKVRAFFDRLRADADDVARKAGAAADLYAKGDKNRKKITNGPGGLASRAGKAREVNLTRIAVSGFSKSRAQEQRVSDPQLKRTNFILAEISKKLTGGGAAVAGS